MGFSTEFRLISLGFLTLSLGSSLNTHWVRPNLLWVQTIAPRIHYHLKAVLYVLKALLSFSWPHSHYDVQCLVTTYTVLNLN